MDTDTVEWFNR